MAMVDLQRQVINHLQARNSTDKAVRDHAEGQWEHVVAGPGVLEVLMQIGSDVEVGVEVRMLAVISVRNFAALCWRLREGVVGHVDAERKHNVKGACLRVLSGYSQTQLSDPLMRQIAFLIAKIARYEQNTWPELLSTLSTGAQHPDPHQQVKYFTTLHYTLSEVLVASRVGTRAGFESLCSQLLQGCVSLSKHYNTTVLQTPHPLPVHLCCLLHKIMQRVLRGVDLTTPSVRDYVQSSLEFLNAAIDLRVAGTGPDTLNPAIKKAIKTLSEIYYNRQGEMSKSGLMEPVVGLCVERVLTVGPFEGKLEGCFFLKVLGILEQVVASLSSDTAIEAAFGRVVGNERVLGLVKVLLGKYLNLHEYEKEAWEADPEAFVFDQEAEDDDINIKQKACNLFCGLADERPELFIGSLIDQINQTLANPNSPPTDTETALHIMGLGCYAFPTHFNDPDKELQWLLLAASFANHSDVYVRRRAVWVVGQWVYSAPPEKYGEIYRLLVSIQCNEANGKVVRLTALNAMKEYIAHELDAEGLAPVLGDFFQSTFALLSGCGHDEMKDHCLAAVGLVVSSVGQERMVQYAGPLATLLKGYWDEEKAKHEGTKIMEQVISCLAKLVKEVDILGPIHSFICSVVHESTDVSDPQCLDLADNAVELWLYTMLSAKVLTPELRQCFSRVLPLLDKSFHSYDHLLNVLHQYILLGGAELLQSHGNEIFARLAAVITSMEGDAKLTVCKITDDVLIMLPALAPACAAPVVTAMLASLNSRPQPRPRVQVLYMSTIARFLLTNKEAAFLTLGSSPDVLAACIDLTTELSDHVSSADHRKTIAMAFSSLLTPPHAQVAQRIDAIASFVVEAVTGEEGEFAASFKQSVEESRTSHFDTHTSHSLEREHALLRADPILNVSMRSWFTSQLQALRSAVGDAQYAEVIKGVQQYNRGPLGL